MKAPIRLEACASEQLSLIIYDESGSFTINERRAAWSEAYDLDQEQKKILCAKIVDEYNRTGKVVESLLDVLKFYKSLPVIDQAMQFPPSYEAQLASQIRADGSTESIKELLSLLGSNTELPNFPECSVSDPLHDSATHP